MFANVSVEDTGETLSWSVEAEGLSTDERVWMEGSERF